jgi:CDP-diglyceride synthetase
LLCYAASVFLRAQKHPRAKMIAQLFWAAGCLVFLAHVAAAFHFYHQWSHALAADDTGRQTFERIGIHFNGGIWFNYLFALIWVADCAGYRRGQFLSERNKTWHLVLHTFFLFMIFNATVVFGHGWAQPAGAVLCAAVIITLLARRRFPS